MTEILPRVRLAAHFDDFETAGRAWEAARDRLKANRPYSIGCQRIIFEGAFYVLVTGEDVPLPLVAGLALGLAWRGGKPAALPDAIFDLAETRREAQRPKDGSAGFYEKRHGNLPEIFAVPVGDPRRAGPSLN